VWSKSTLKLLLSTVLLVAPKNKHSPAVRPHDAPTDIAVDRFSTSENPPEAVESWRGPQGFIRLLARQPAPHVGVQDQIPGRGKSRYGGLPVLFEVEIETFSEA
jgi:hypothetical protein